MWSIFILLPETTKIKQILWKNHFQDSEHEKMQESNPREKWKKKVYSHNCPKLKP